MGICWWSTSHRRGGIALFGVFFFFLFFRCPTWPAFFFGWRCPSLYLHFSKHGDDHRDATNHRRAASIDQLQRLVCTDDHVWSRAGEQCLDSPKSSRLTSAFWC